VEGRASGSGGFTTSMCVDSLPPPRSAAAQLRVHFAPPNLPFSPLVAIRLPRLARSDFEEEAIALEGQLHDVHNTGAAKTPSGALVIAHACGLL